MSYWSKLSMKDRADVMKLFLDKGISDLDTMRREYNIFAGGGDTNPGMTGMMKSKLATAAHFGNPTARRMTNYDARSYTWPGEYEYDNGIGELKRGNVFVGSYDNLVTPQIQDTGKGLTFVDDVWSPENDQRSYMQSLKFNNEKDARYFGEHYKEVAPMMNIYAGGGNTNDADLVDWIIKEEGFNTKPEDIGDGKISLGSGLTDPKWHALYKKRGNKWSEADNRMAVAEEVANRRRWAEKTIPNWEALPDSSQKALLSYKYNYDFTPTNSPKLFKALADSNFREAARQMDATSKDPKFKEGLMERRLREQEWFLADLANQSIRRPNQTLAPIDTSLQQITAPAVSTAVTNKYVPSTIHPYTRLENARRAMETAVAFNRMLDNTSIQNNLSEYQFPIGNGYADGGKIHIKPSHRGRLTELKKRTGKSEAELYKTGGPAVRKMITFARNARKWKHGLGGLLEI